jgi:site-specific DNA-methyltransferase (adenine-specific)
MDQLAKADPASTEHGHRLICGDCLTVLPTIDAGSVDVVVTSPPYNLGMTYRGYDDRRKEDDYLDWLTHVAHAVRRVMKAEGSFFLNISGTSSAPGCRSS